MSSNDRDWGDGVRHGSRFGRRVAAFFGIRPPASTDADGTGGTSDADDA